MRTVRCHLAICTILLFFLSLLPSLILPFTVTPRLPKVVFQKTTTTTTTTSSKLLQSSSNYQQQNQKKDRRPWLPPQRTYDDDDIFSIDHERERLEDRSISYIANSINLYLLSSSSPSSTTPAVVSASASRIARGKFLDLTITKKGELALEHLISTGVVDRDDDDASSFSDDDDVIRGAIVALQSLLILGMQIGVKGSPMQQRRMVSHLSPVTTTTPSPTEGKSHRPRPRPRVPPPRSQSPLPPTTSLKERFQNWTYDSIGRLKHDRDITAGIQILSSLKMKQSAVGAFELLVRLGAWGRHEDVVFLRSGFPARFTTEEEDAAREAEESSHDPDTLLGIRRDLRHLKTYTIDGASTSEIDDGLSVETLATTNSDGSTSPVIRYWIHIADADRWCPQHSRIIKAARRRMTSLYLPTGTIPMFPKRIGVDRMSLTTSRPSSTPALSLGVRLHPDGSIDESSLVLTSSLVTVSYRLTYADVDEMLMEGVAYDEEWPLGALLEASRTRRRFRMGKGSMEAMIPTPIPRGTVTVDGTGDGVTIGVSVDEEEEMASPANLLVTEMMILAGEAMGIFGILSQKKKTKVNENADGCCYEIDNELQLPYRSQKKPDFESNETGYMTLQNLQKTKAGNGYCAAWYFRRFFSPVKVSLVPHPHHGMGLDCYVQWTSPIRRYSDLQVHAAVKRYLRRERINELLRNGEPIPSFISDVDLGCPLPNDAKRQQQQQQQTRSPSKDNDDDISTVSSVEDHITIDYDEGRGMFLAARPLQRQSETYWLFEYIRRATLINNNNDDDDADNGSNESERNAAMISSLECTVLGCVDSSRHQYCVYVHEWGLEHRYLSEMGPLTLGQVIFLKVASVNPRMGLLTLTLAPPPDKRGRKGGGRRS